MISYIIGKVKYIGEGGFVLECENIGYKLFSSLNSLQELEVNNEYKIYTSLQVREDDLSLYGFATKEELDMFELLITVSSIGPKNALGILSSLSITNIKRAIVNNDIDALTKAKGVGKKTASRIILELVDRVKATYVEEADFEENLQVPQGEDFEVAREALINLGYQRNDVDLALASLRGEDLPLEKLIKECLKRLA